MSGKADEIILSSFFPPYGVNSLMYLVMRKKQLSLSTHFSVRVMLAEAKKGCWSILSKNMQLHFLEGVPFNLLHEISI